MGAYLDLAGFRDRTTMPDGDVDGVEAAAPGWIDRKLAAMSAEIDARLSKRYDVPFMSPFPGAVQDWLERIVTPRVYFLRGVNPDDAQFQELKADADAAWRAVAEAADSSIGLYDLPLRSDTNATGITRGTPLAYAEASPYSWTDAQHEAIRYGGR
jgi:hypothetical protein